MEPVVCTALDSLQLLAVASPAPCGQWFQGVAPDACETILDLVDHGESVGASAFLEGRPLQLCQHVGDTGCVTVAVKDKTRCSSLDLLEVVCGLLSVGIPDAAGILDDGSYHGFVCQLPGFAGGHFQIPPQEAQRSVGFVVDVVDVGVPGEVVLYRHPEVLG